MLDPKLGPRTQKFPPGQHWHVTHIRLSDWSIQKILRSDWLAAYSPNVLLMLPEGLKSRAELLLQLGRLSLPQEDTVPILRKQQALAAQAKNPEIVQLNTPLVKPTAICVASTNILLCVDDEHQRIIQWELSYNRVAVVGTSLREMHYPDGVRVSL